jgi:hypothetical protein
MSPKSRLPILRSIQHRLNCRRGARIGLELTKLGFSPIVPHFNGYLPKKMREQVVWQDWLGMDLEQVRRVDVVLRLPDLDPEFPSKGAVLECNVARRNGVPVIHGGVEELLDWHRTHHPELKLEVNS